MVCGDCGVVMPWGCNIADVAAYANRDQFAPPPRDAVCNTPLLSRIREVHPSCFDAALDIVARLVDRYPRAFHPSVLDRVSQAIAHIAYKQNGTYVSIQALAKQVNMPEERLSKEVREISSHSCVSATEIQRFNGVGRPDVAEGFEEFGAAVLSFVRPGTVRGGRTTVVQVTRWCKSRYDRMRSLKGNERFMNSAPSKQAQAAILLYAQEVDDPFCGGVAAVVSSRNAVVRACVVEMRRLV